VAQETETIDYAELERLAAAHTPRLILAGASAYPRIIDFPRLRAIADGVGAYLMVDMAHIAGLVVAGVHPSPVPYADIVTSTTHKTLRGPRGGLILAKAEYAAKLDKAVFPGAQGGPLEHIIAAKAVAFAEAASPAFTAYQKQVAANAQALAKALNGRGLSLVSGGTDNHLMLVKLIGKGITGKELEHLLDEAKITTNKNAVPFDPLPPNVTSGVRIGTPAATTRGMKEPEMSAIGNLIADIAERGKKAVPAVKREVKALTAAFPLYK
jgi:glycine hydroxymethyltransferase